MRDRSSSIGQGSGPAVTSNRLLTRRGSEIEMSAAQILTSTMRRLSCTSHTSGSVAPPGRILPNSGAGASVETSAREGGAATRRCTQLAP